MHPVVLVVGHDDLRLQATRDALAFGRLLNPVVACTDLDDVSDYLHARAPYTPRDKHPLPAVIVTELHLPTGGAADVLRLVQSRLQVRRTPVVVVSDEASDEEIDEVHRLGAAAHLDRSVATDVLLGVIRDTGMPWALGRRGPSPAPDLRLPELVADPA